MNRPSIGSTASEDAGEVTEQPVETGNSALEQTEAEESSNVSEPSTSDGGEDRGTVDYQNQYLQARRGLSKIGEEKKELEAKFNETLSELEQLKKESENNSSLLNKLKGVFEPEGSDEDGEVDPGVQMLQDLIATVEDLKAAKTQTEEERWASHEMSLAEERYEEISGVTDNVKGVLIAEIKKEYGDLTPVQEKFISHEVARFIDEQYERLNEWVSEGLEELGHDPESRDFIGLVERGRKKVIAEEFGGASAFEALLKEGVSEDIKELIKSDHAARAERRDINTGFYPTMRSGFAEKENESPADVMRRMGIIN